MPGQCPLCVCLCESQISCWPSPSTQYAILHTMPCLNYQDCKKKTLVHEDKQSKHHGSAPSAHNIEVKTARIGVIRKQTCWKGYAPGLPLPRLPCSSFAHSGESQAGSPALACFHSAKSLLFLFSMLAKFASPSAAAAEFIACGASLPYVWPFSLQIQKSAHEVCTSFTKRYLRCGSDYSTCTPCWHAEHLNKGMGDAMHAQHACPVAH